MPTNRVHLDFETRSIVDLRTCGSTMYAQHYTTMPLMCAWIDGTGELLYDFMSNPILAGTSYPMVDLGDPLLHSFKPTIPVRMLDAIAENATFVAHNARFEQDIWYWVCHKRWGWPMPSKWSCTAARSAYWGIRRSLEGSASDLELPVQKATEEGKAFINEFCVPRKWKGPKKNGNIALLWSEPAANPVGWEKGKTYCMVDAQAEKGIDDILPDLPVFEQLIWDLDFKINTRGIPIDTDCVGKAMHFSDHFTQAAVQRFNAITALNPTQRDRVLEYLNQRGEVEGLGQIESLKDLRSKTLGRLVQDDLPIELRDVINIRLDAARASVKKLEAMERNTSDDGFARGLFVYYGAHTGRASAKRIQPHNFIRGKDTVADIMFQYLTNGVWESGLGNNGMPQWVNHADLLFVRPLKALAQSMRGFIKAPDGKKIVSGDYAQIEARVLAWLACCETLLYDFRTGKDTYVRFAAEHMYRRRYEDYFGPDHKVLPHLADERQRAKSAVLGCGFQLGGRGFLEYCDNLNIILTQEEADFTVKAYRNAYPEISDWNTGLWARINWCAIEATINEGKTIPLWGTEITFHVHRLDTERYWLIITLPSGRHIAYYRPKADTVNQWGKPVLSFRTEWMGKTYREQTYGGRITENIVQGIARDICMIGALNADAAGYDVFGTIHDEVLSLADEDKIPLMRPLEECLLDMPAWTQGLPMNAEVKYFDRYTK